MENRVRRTRSRKGSLVGQWEGCSQTTRGEGTSGRFERKKVTRDESTRHSDGRIG